MNSKMMMQATIQNINISPQLNYSIEKIQEMVQEMARMITVALQQWAEADSPDLKAKARCRPKNWWINQMAPWMIMKTISIKMIKLMDQELVLLRRLCLQVDNPKLS